MGSGQVTASTRLGLKRLLSWAAGGGAVTKGRAHHTSHCPHTGAQVPGLPAAQVLGLAMCPWRAPLSLPPGQSRQPTSQNIQERSTGLHRPLPAGSLGPLTVDSAQTPEGLDAAAEDAGAWNPAQAPGKRISTGSAFRERGWGLGRPSRPQHPAPPGAPAMQSQAGAINNEYPRAPGPLQFPPHPS